MVVLEGMNYQGYAQRIDDPLGVGRKMPVVIAYIIFWLFELCWPPQLSLSPRLCLLFLYFHLIFP
jgi:hypothetical protein